MVYEAKSRFRINLVPQDTNVSFKKQGGFNIFHLFIKNRKMDDDLYLLLKNAIEKINKIKTDEEEQKSYKFPKIYYYCLETDLGILRLEINYGGKYKVDLNHPPTISLETRPPAIPTAEFLAEIKNVVKLLVKKTGFKIYFWDAAKFVTVDELYGREGPK